MLELLNVINISVSQAPVGLGAYNVNNLALFTSDAFLTNPNSDLFRVYVSPTAVGLDFGTGTETYQQAVAVFSQQPNILAGGGALIIFPLLTSESLDSGIARCKDMIFFCGVISTTYGTNTGWKTMADDVQALGDKILFLPSNDPADIAGAFTNIKNASDYNTRCLLYTTSALSARLFAAAYASRALSVNFAGSNTAITMNLKQLATIVPDAAVTQTVLANAGAAGVDLYVSYAGVPSVFSSGANKFLDSVYNLIAFVSQLKVNGFNALAQLTTKVSQTETGISLLKTAYRLACEQFLGNGYIAPGAWTSPETFGANQNDFFSNIAQRGYFIFSTPVNQQAASDRQARKAPLIQIAVKEAGAVHSSAVVVSVNP